MKKFFGLLLALGLGGMAAPVYALPTLLPDCALSSEGDCTLCDLYALFINLANYMAAIAGGLVLIMLIIGFGFWIFSRGNDEMVKKGTDILKGAFMGFAVMVLAWVMVNFVIFAISGQDIENVRIFSKEWFNADCDNKITPECKEKYSGSSCNDDYSVCYKGVTTDDASRYCGEDGSGCECVTKCKFLMNTTNYDCIEQDAKSECPSPHDEYEVANYGAGGNRCCCDIN